MYGLYSFTSFTVPTFPLTSAIVPSFQRLVASVIPVTQGKHTPLPQVLHVGAYRQFPGPLEKINNGQKNIPIIFFSDGAILVEPTNEQLQGKIEELRKISMFNPFSFFPDADAVPVETVKQAIDNHDQIILLDVRTQEEYREIHIKGSILIPLQEIGHKFSSLGKKEQKIYTYCRSGARSAQAAIFLRQQGFTDVHNMSGGLLSWMAKNFPLVR